MSKLLFEDILKTYYSVDDFDYGSLSDDLKKTEKKICPLCHKEFYGCGRNGTRQRYCKRTHYINCAVCGKPVAQIPPSEKYGSVKCTCSKECTTKFKAQQTFSAIEDKYGYSNISQVPEFKEKISAGIKAKSEETTKKVVATMTERYGGMGTASPILREKIEATTLERYGVKNPSYSEEVRKKISEVNSSPEVIAKYEATAIARWGVNRPSKTKEVQQKMKQTSLEKYGVECALQTDYAKEQLEKVSLEKYGVTNPLFSDYARRKANDATIANMKKGYHNRISKVNQSAASYLQDEYGISVEFEWPVGRYNFDLKIADSNILLEINPSYTHSILPNHWDTKKGKDSNYHLNKTIAAEEAGYRCIHVFDWDDPKKIASMLIPKQSIYARKCKLVKLNYLQVKQFINNNHIQGDAKGGKHCYALLYDDEIIEVMTFGKPRYTKKYQWELLRLCTDSRYRVIGGASKMFSQFIKDVDPQSILSYCDRAKFTGSVYTQLGMVLHHTSDPSKVWSRGTEYITDNYLRQRGYDQLFDTDYGKGTSNEALMIENKWLPVYDCGQYVFEWVKGKN